MCVLLSDHSLSLIISQEAQNADGTWKSAFIPHNVAERIQERLPFSGSVRGKNPKSDSAASPSSPDALSPKSTFDLILQLVLHLCTRRRRSTSRFSITITFSRGARYAIETGS